ncbi:anti-anti-sigma factor [Catenuloplanes atrovinosus]|uniref:Anti-anti-sigma factor n=2 Tax=Catenuloplanes atrovinosus TaxID=137266 RepID=A0AAE3YMJ0_9ACTN|nr:anti-anti-sigma factor [Catenuloplanes atrovinosus]
MQLGQAALIELTIAHELVRQRLPAVRLLIEQALARRPARLVLDLAECPTIDASGIELLLSTHRRLWRSEGRLALRRPTARVLRLLEISHATKVLEIDAS